MKMNDKKNPKTVEQIEVNEQKKYCMMFLEKRGVVLKEMEEKKILAPSE